MKIFLAKFFNSYFISLLLCLFGVATINTAIAQEPQVPLVQLAPELEERARALGQELRCPVCSGLSIAESPSDFARNMLNEVRRQVKAGKTNQEILDFFGARYGQDVKMVPAKTGAGLILWLAPLAAVVLGGAGLLAYLNRASAPANISQEQLQQVQEALKENP